MHTIAERPEGPLVSAPERALLELLSEIGQSEEVEEARNIFEMLFTLCVGVLSTLLQHCTRAEIRSNAPVVSRRAAWRMNS